MEAAQLPQHTPHGEVQGGAPVAQLGGAGLQEESQQSLLHLLWRRRWSVLLVVVLALAVGFIYLAQATPLYTSTAQLYIEKSGPKIISEEQAVMMGGKNYLYTQCELLRSTPILAGAVENLDPTSMKTFPPGSNAIGYIRQGLSTDVGRKDEIISVSFESPHPEEAAQIVNAVVDAYITFHAEKKRDTAAEVLKILRKEKAKRDADYREGLKAMLEFKQKNPTLAFQRDGGNIILDRLARLSEALNTAQLALIDAKATYEATKALTSDPAKLRQFLDIQGGSGTGNAHRRELARLQAELADLDLRAYELRRQVTEDHPALQALENKQAELRKRLAEAERKCAEAAVSAAAQRVEAARRKEEEIRRTFEEQRQKALSLNAQVAKFTMLQSDLEQTRKLCDTLNDRIKEINVTENTGALNITVLEVARTPSSPSSPQKARTMALALVLGAMLGVGLALARDWMDQRIHSAEEIPARIGIPVLGIVPQMGRQDIYTVGRQAETRMSQAAEAYRTIRTGIYFGVPNGNARSLLVTSPAAGDGKTTVASNLAIAMAQAGQRVLLIDADFRKPMQHQVFEVDDEHGLSNVLAGQCALTDAINSVAIENLDLLPCGPIPPNPSEMLNSAQFVDILRELSERYDHIILDSPPVMAVADARILGAVCDVTVLVFRAERSHRKGAARARDGLTSVGAEILGAVVNAVPRSHQRYYYYYYGYGGKYAYGYGHEERRERRRLPEKSNDGRERGQDSPPPATDEREPA